MMMVAMAMCHHKCTLVPASNEASFCVIVPTTCNQRLQHPQKCGLAMHLMSFIMLYHCSFERYHFAWHWVSPKLYTPILTLGIYVRAEIETGCCRESTMLIQVDSTILYTVTFWCH